LERGPRRGRGRNAASEKHHAKTVDDVLPETACYDAVLMQAGRTMLTLDEVVDTFELLGDWDQRYQYLVELGQKLPPLPEAARTEDNRVKGCMSQVWVQAYRDPDAMERLRYHGDCDTTIIKGVLTLLIQMAEGRTTAEMEALDVDEFFERLQLDEHLSPNRHVGVYAIVELMKKQARELAG
jgi:cysteine desulfuration protein SufE